MFDDVDLFEEPLLSLFKDDDYRSLNASEDTNHREIREIYATISDFSNNSEWLEDSNNIFYNKDISDNQSATLEGTFENLESFEYKVSSEETYDFLSIYLNDERVIHISGEQDWDTYTLINQENTTTLKIVYAKDEMESAGADTGYIRNVKYKSNVLDVFLSDCKISRTFNEQKSDNNYAIKNFSNYLNYSKHAIHWYKEKQNFTFNRIGLKQSSLKRVKVWSFDD